MGTRAAAFCALGAGLLLLFLVVRYSHWTLSPISHQLMELASALVASMVGVLALVRFYSRRNDTLLLIGSAMVGTAILDGYHLFVTLRGAALPVPADPQAAETWSWFGARLFLALVFLWSWAAWRAEGDEAYERLSEVRVYLEVGAFTILSIALFGLVDLPPSVHPDAMIPQPYEFIPGVAYAMATVGYLWKGNWRARSFEVWLVPALIVSTAAQCLFVPFSVTPVDAFGTAAHALKLLSYSLILVGLLASMYGLYRQVERSAHLIRHKNQALEAEIDVRREAERQARVSEQKYRTILETIQEGYFEVDLAGNFVFWNDSLAELLGYPHQRLEGLNYRAYTSEGQAASVFETFGQVYRTGKPVQVFGWEILRADGARRCAEASAGPVHGEEGEIVGFRGIVRDVTARRTAEERLEAKTRELARSNEELRQFAYVASHDLQEPLRMVAGYTRLLARRYEGQLDEEADLFIRYAIEGVARMQQLIRDLLDYSRVQTHGQRFVETPLEDPLRWAISNLDGAIECGNAQVTFDVLPTVDGDPVQLGQLFQNLIANALKFHGPRTPVVHVGVQSRPGVCQVYVRDNGIGIDPEYRGRVFEIFQRLHPPDEYEGTGIGLAICKRIVERHGGQIWIEPSPGQGTTFVFTLPREGDAEAEAAETEDGLTGSEGASASPSPPAPEAASPADAPA